MAYIGNTPTQQAFTPAVDFFNGNGSTTAFTLSRPVASVAQVQAVVENVPQKPGDAYTVSGNTITFTSAPPSGTNNIYVYYTSPITQVIAPGQGTVGPTALTAGAPSWSPSGGVTLPRIDSTNEGGQLNFNRASDDTATWSIDSFGNTSTPSLRFINGATVAMAIDGSNNVGIGTASPSVKLDVVASTTSSEAAIRVRSQFGSGYFGAWANYPAMMYESSGLKPVVVYDTNNHLCQFYTNNAERGRFDASGNLLVGGTNSQPAAAGLPGNIVSTFSGSSKYGINITTSTSGTSYLAWFGYSAYGVVGTISTNGTTTAYNTSSDYRLKHDVQPITGALARVSALKPVTYKWNADDSNGEGFIAHELQEVVPDCVTGEKDAVDADGNPVYQGIDTSFLVATLTAAIKEQQAIIEQLTQRITALEAK